MSRPPEAADPASGGPAPLVGPMGALIALACAIVLCWPIWITHATFVFPDTGSYLRGGAAIWAVAGDILSNGAPAGAPVADAPATGAVSAGGIVTDGKGQAAVGRSLTYSAAAFGIRELFGSPAVAIAQTWLTVFVAFALITADALRRPALLAAGGVWLAVLTPLPFYAAFLMPDLLAAVPILFAACIVWRWAALTAPQKVVLTVLAAAATSAHYGTVPLALGCVVGAMALVALDGRLPRAGMVAAAVAVVGFGPVFNLGASSATLDRASTAPLHLPILLARSIDDGPALWFLQDRCPAGEFETCAVLGGDIPDNAGTFLWSSRGLAAATPEQMDLVRQEEWAILAGAFLDYPMAQTSSLLRNAARQTTLVGLDGVDAVGGLDAAFDPVRTGDATQAGRALVRGFDGPVVWGAWGAALALAVLAILARPGRRAALAVVAVLGGLALNAAIFGGLSAPVERYQSRVIWVLPFVLLAVVAHARASREAMAAATGAARPGRPEAVR